VFVLVIPQHWGVETASKILDEEFIQAGAMVTVVTHGLEGGSLIEPNLLERCVRIAANS
jgi:hypothetical protein